MDMETIKNGLRLCTNGEPCVGEKFASCPFSPRHNAEPNCGVTMARACLALLKEQDPVPPILRPSIKGLAWHCGSCDWKMIEVPDTVTYEVTKGAISYCANCGRAVKWDD